MAYTPGSMDTYVANVEPILEGGDSSFVLAELAKIQDVFRSTQAMIPQAANKAPSSPQDGMVRLARAPWRPVADQTGDAWVYFDGSSSTWMLLPTAPS